MTVPFIFIIIKSKIFHRRKPFLKLMLHIQLELRYLAHRTSFIIVVLHEIRVGISRHVEFNSVVAGRDGVHIEVNVHVGLNGFDVVEVDDDEHVDECSDGADGQAEQLTLLVIC